MITIKTINGKEVEFENVAAVFDKTRKERNEYFGKYVAEKPINIDAVDVEKKADEAEKLTAQVSTMTGEQLAVLKAAIKATEIQQQN